MEELSPSPEHVLSAALSGELAPLREEASRVTAEAFARGHGVEVHSWGKNDVFEGVTVEGVEYLWKKATGLYDGWELNMAEMMNPSPVEEP